MSERSFALQINGVAQHVQGPQAMPLLQALRDGGLTGTRFGCGTAQCGACHVLVDGVSLPACDTPLWAVEGKQVQTIEGLGTAAALHPLQQAFIEEQAAQCGYCLSGILMTASALLARNAHPTDAEVRQALDGHLCRCGSHNRMVRAVLRAADAMAAAPKAVA